MVLVPLFLGLVIGASLRAAAPPPPPVVDCVAGLWDAPPSDAPTVGNVVSNGAYTGNGDLGVVVGAAPVAQTTLAFFMDLMQFRCPSSTGKSKCGYGSGGHAGVGWLGVDVQGPLGRNTTSSSFAMQQIVKTAEVTTQTTFADSGVVLNSRLVAHASENLAVVEVWFNRSSSAAPRTLSLLVSDAVYNAPGPSTSTRKMDCRTNNVGQHAAAGAPLRTGAGERRAGAGTVSAPAWQWGQSWLGRGYQDHRRQPSPGVPTGGGSAYQAHHDVFPLTSRVEHVVMATAFGGEFLSRTNASSDSDGRLGSRAWSTVTVGEQQVLRLSTQLWTARDFDFKRDPMDAAAESMRSVEDPAHIAQLERSHRRWWADYWGKSAISMPHSRRTELFWYGAVYMWGTANRANWTSHMPPAGLWKNHYTGNDYGWPAYTTDINTQAPYFATYSSNHQDIASAMYQLNLDFIPAGRMLATYAFKCPGIIQPVEIGARGEIFIMEDQGIRSNAILAAMIFVMHWEHTLDVAWLRTVGYPFLKEVAAFWSCYLVKDEQTGMYLDLNDCCYEICGANDYASDHGHIFTNYEKQDNPANSLGMIRALFATMISGSEALGVDSALRPDWQDILDNLHPYPTATVTLPDGQVATILADWQGAPPPPKNDRQMLSSIQPIYPGGQFWRSMPNQTAFAVAVDTMKYLDYYSVQADTFCIMYTISGRVGANQTVVFPQMVKTNLQWGQGGQTFMRNLMTLPQIGPAALVYVNELFVQSHESFVRIYPAHFSDTGALGGPPRGPPSAAAVQSTLGPATSSTAGGTTVAPEAACGLTGNWSMPIGHGTLTQNGKVVTGQCCATPTKPADKEFTITGIYTGQPPGPPPPPPPPPPPVPVWPGRPECGTAPGPPPPPIPAGPSNLQFTFHEKSGDTTALVGSVSADCNSIAWVGRTASPPYTRGWKSARVRGRSGTTRQAALEEETTERTGIAADADPEHGAPTRTLRPWLGSSFTTLRTHKAFLVSGSLSERGQVGPVTVLSERGGNFTFLSPWPRAQAVPTVTAAGGQAVAVSVVLPKPTEVHLAEGEKLFAFTTRVNGSYTIAEPKQ